MRIDGRLLNRDQEDFGLMILKSMFGRDNITGHPRAKPLPRDLFTSAIKLSVDAIEVIWECKLYVIYDALDEAACYMATNGEGALCVADASAFELLATLSPLHTTETL